MKKFLIAMLVAVMMAAVPLSVIADDNVLQNQAVNGGVINQNIIFIDIDQDYWAYDAIADMSKRGVINGYDDETFKPQNSITREEFAKLIAMTFSLDLPNPEQPTFADVQPDRWSYSYIEAAKEFLTGYFPPKGKSFYSPETKTTREDVAVALVKVLGYTPDDLEDPNILERNFVDVNEMSFGLRDYIALATEKQLISGYDDYTFRPENPITRAEVATLLYRSIKSSAMDQGEAPLLDVSMPATTSSGTYYISGKTNKNAKVTINGKEIKVDNGEFKEGFRLEKEGTYNISIVAKNAGNKQTTVTKTITFEQEGPKLVIDDLPATTTSQTIDVSGQVTDNSDKNASVYLNDQKLDVYGSSFRRTVTLQEGENELVFKAKNSAGKTTTVVRTITLNLGGPALKIDDIPESTTSQTLSVSGTVKDNNDKNPTVYLNDEKLDVYGSSFSRTVTLQEGENVLVFKAKNSGGKTTTVTKTIQLNLGGPVLTIDDMPETTKRQSLSVSGTVKDKNDKNPTVYLNDEKLDVYGSSFSRTVTLQQGENVLVFKAKNSGGKVTLITKTVVFNPEGPKLNVNYVPETSSQSTVSVSGTVTDVNDSSPGVYVNDSKLYTYGSSFDKSVSLQKGNNTIVVKATNKFGQTTTVTKNVYYP
ncbi:S-layer homology domain-containing protein [Paenibacillus cymbidii]|uniref:S-layer homology domain-containing protein n=1 Tax=Paenibacillus cymbidii TaxID=1639034 RepID=UPI001F470BF6|nr:S-layer homology domain-containing protein [Paenibacillus cymbidii]